MVISTATRQHIGQAPIDFARGFMTAGEGEFLGLSRAEASAGSPTAAALIEDVIGRPIAGFVAPAWLYGDGAHEALRQAAIPIAEDHFSVWSPATGSGSRAGR